MSNTSNCDFRKTNNELRKCLQALENKEHVGVVERDEAMHMFNYMLLTMRLVGVIDGYDEDKLQEYMDEMGK